MTRFLSRSSIPAAILGLGLLAACDQPTTPSASATLAAQQASVGQRQANDPRHEAQPGDDRGVDRRKDDNGNDPQHEPQPGDDRGGDRRSSSAGQYYGASGRDDVRQQPQPGDQRHGKDDGAAHR